MGLLTLAILLVGGFCALLLGETVIRRTDAGAGLVLALLLLNEGATGLNFSLNVGPATVLPRDVVTVLLLAAATARLMRDQTALDLRQRLLLLFALLLAWSLARGAIGFGLPAAVNEARKFLGFFAAALYFCTLEPRRELLDRLGWLWVAYALALVGISLLRWIGNAVGLTTGFFQGYEAVRVVPAAAALVMAQAALFCLPLLTGRERPLLRWLTPLFLAFVVLLQHRSVWVATILGVLVVLWLQRSLAKRVLTGLSAAVIVLALVSVVAFEGGSEEVGDQLTASSQRTNTWEWRVAGWVAIVADSQPAGVGELVTGQPFGGGWDRRQEGVYGSVEVSPHNFYIESYLRIGLAGVALLLLIYAAVLSPTYRAGRAGEQSRALLSPAALHVALAMQLLFYLPYSPDIGQGMLVGIAASVAAHYTKTSTEPPPRRVAHE